MKCQLYEQLNEDTVKCTACNHYCKIQPGKTGICGVRLNKSGKLMLTVYGHPCAKHMDPMEKKPMYHLCPGSQIYSLGTIGCNFKCDFCQNWQISQDRPRDLEDAVAEYPMTSPEQVINHCLKTNTKFVASTYNEPTIWSEYALDIARAGLERGVRAVYVSNGFMSPEAAAVIAPLIVGINIDLKCFKEETYRAVMGGGLKQVCDNIRFFFEAGVVTEVTTLIVPDLNDSDEELRGIAEFLSSVSPQIPWHVSAFHPDFKRLDAVRTPVDTLERAFNIGRKAGLVNIYVGNARTSHENTVCQCGEILVRRRNYDVEICNGFKGGACGKCGKKVYGVFE